MQKRKKNGKRWSINANRARDRKRLLEGGEIRKAFEEDEIVFEIKRKLTNEHIVITLLPGDRSDNYRPYKDGKLWLNKKTKSGCFGMNEFCKRLALALPPLNTKLLNG